MTAREEPELTVIAPPRSWPGLGLGELWRSRHLVAVFARRNVAVRYKQAPLGVAWAIVQPLAAAGVFSLFFGKLARMPSDGLPYPLFAFTALVPWTYCAQSVAASAQSVIDHRAVITKVYFPRLVLPIAPLLSGLLDLAMGLLVLVPFAAAYDVVPGLSILALPAFVLLGALTSLAAGLWLAALSARWSDFRHVVPFAIQVWLFASPVAYPASLVPERWRPLYGLNPMTGVIEGFRWSVLGTGAAPSLLHAVSAAVVLLLLLGGIAVFRRIEPTMSDVV